MNLAVFGMHQHLSAHAADKINCVIARVEDRRRVNGVADKGRNYQCQARAWVGVHRRSPPLIQAGALQRLSVNRRLGTGPLPAIFQSTLPDRVKPELKALSASRFRLPTALDMRNSNDEAAYWGGLLVVLAIFARAFVQRCSRTLPSRPLVAS